MVTGKQLNNERDGNVRLTGDNVKDYTKGGVPVHTLCALRPAN